MSRSHFPCAPRDSQALEEAIEISIAVREDTSGVSGGEAGEMLLDRSDLIEQSKRIESR
jgi:hypothetical protein